MARVALLALAAAAAGQLASAQCHNKCSGHGTCGLTGTCSCYSGYHGADCSLRTCPTGSAWVGSITADETAHAAAVTCSGFGHCNTASGVCECRVGYHGRACERMDCPTNSTTGLTCNGHGKCLNMFQAGLMQDGNTLNNTAAYSTPWDAKRIYGCACDSGYSGYDCSQRECLVGKDPRVSGHANEVIYLYCSCAATCSGSFQLSFLGKKSAPIAYDADATTLATAIMNIPSVKNHASGFSSAPVTTSFSAGAQVCDAAGITTTITFAAEDGDMQAMLAHPGGLASTGVAPTLQFHTVQTLTCGSCAGACDGTLVLQHYNEFTSVLDLNTVTANDIQTALEGLEHLSAGDVTVTMTGALCQDTLTNAASITFTMAMGNQPLLKQHSDVSTGTATITLTGTDGDDSKAGVCSNIGKCDYGTGTCTCPSSYRGDLYDFDWDYKTCGSTRYNTSSWQGTQRCPGYINKATGKEFEMNNRRVLFWFEQGDGSSVTSRFGYHQNALYDADSFMAPSFFYSSATSTNHIFQLDMDYRYLWFTDSSTPGVYKIQHLQDNSGATASLVANTGADIPTGFALDLRPGKRKFYYTVAGADGTADGKLFVGDMSNGALTELTSFLNTALVDPEGIALDLKYERLYWVDSGSAGVTDGKLYYADLTMLESSTAQTQVEIVSYDNTVYLIDPTSVALDIHYQQFFVTDNAKVWQLNTTKHDSHMGDVLFTSLYDSYDNTGKQNLVTPNAVQIDKETDFIYFVDAGARQLLKAPMNPDETVTNKYTLVVTAIPDLGSDSDYGFGGAVSAMYQPAAFVWDFGHGPPEVDHYECFGHGTCGGVSDNFRCTCNDGWFGNCNMTSCPTGPVWFEDPLVANEAHLREDVCSNRGACDHDTGLCLCQDGWTGAACERMECPKDPLTGEECSGHGRCVTMREIARNQTDATTLDKAAYTYGNVETSWDADMISVCLCDDIGYGLAVSSSMNVQRGLKYTGYDCSRIECPKGDNPTYALTREITTVTCTSADAANAQIALLWDGAYTSYLAGTADETAVQSALAALSGITTVSVASSSAGNAWCNAGGSITLTITIHSPKGSATNLASRVGAGAATLGFTESDAGTFSTWRSREVQTMTCTSASPGAVQLLFEFRGAFTVSLVGTSTEVEIEAALDNLPTIGDVAITSSNAGAAFCDSTGSVTLTITYKTEFGSLPLVAATVAAGTATVNIQQSTAASKTATDCSDHGICDPLTGTCNCFDGWASSDGDGGNGLRMDCGHLSVLG
eukprot:CAMPEP_0118881234 /NCGR_PEP_ID=MMETSP1163-20130328/20733_1 /TAXON_ID=124430 /ORGANISM="Phaeomonas parva, Strain CCMP2877" /LENGTH=1262 /DNA_ID=CAMNT_0006817951 /DNA_START=152 /DNA_END=3940 /DNA_ORIENTATION=+